MKAYVKDFIIKLLALIVVISTTLLIGVACKKEDPTPPPHVCSYSIKTVVSPTCTEQGYTLYECTCGKNYKDNFVDMLGHNTHEEKVNEIKATCTTGGSYDIVIYCDVCNEEINRNTIEVKKLGHNLSEYVSNNDATCYQNGTKTATCKRTGCNYSKTETDDGSMLSHNYRKTVILPTCTEQGYTLNECNGCSYKFKDNFVAPLGHSPAVTSVIIESMPTCETNGKEIQIYTCIECEVETSRTTVETDAIGHDFVNYVSDNNATCLGNGTKTATCENGCGKTHTVELENSALGHTFTNYVSNGDATCTEDGTKTATCDNGCGVTHTVDDENSALGHTFTNYASNGDATCLGNGTETAKCNRCTVTHTKTEEDSATGHTYQQNVTPATCFNGGYTTFVCHCNDTYVGNYVDALGHVFTNYVSNGDATCLGNGTMTATCDRGCGTTDTVEDVNAVGEHQPNDSVKENNHLPTCTQSGSFDRVIYCNLCKGELLRETITVDATGHNYQIYTISKNATCDDNETKTSTCENGCGETHTIEIPGTALGHNYQTYVYNNDATCVKNETKTSTCENGCGKTYTAEIPGTAFGHNYQTYVYNNDATYEADGTKTAVCENGCGETDTIVAEGTKLNYSIGLTYLLNADGKSYTVTSIGDCTDLNVIIPAVWKDKPVTGIGNNAFKDLKTITSVTIPDSVTSIGAGAFYNCTSITEMVIPNGVSEIKTQTFEWCINLTKLVLGSGITEVNQTAFKYCYRLVEVINNSPYVTLSVGGADGSIGYYALSVSNNNPNYVSKLVVDDNGFVIYVDGDQKTLVNYYGNGGNVTIPTGVSVIKNHAMHNKDAVISVTMPSTVTHIETNAFSYMDVLERVEIGRGVVGIDSQAFHECKNLVTVDNYSPNFKVSAGSEDYGELCKNATNVTNFREYVVKYYFENEDGIYVENEEFKTINYAPIGEVVTVSEEVYGNYYFVPSASITQITINDAESYNVLKLYYNPHKFVPTVIAPTCNEKGYTVYNCGCGDSYIDETSYVDAVGHTFTNYVPNNDATCFNDGTKTAKCVRCDVTNTINNDNSKLIHQFVNYVSDNNATETEDGTKTAYCEHGCGTTNTIVDDGTILNGKFTYSANYTLTGIDFNIVVSNDTLYVDFNRDFTVSGNATFKVYLDITRQNELTNKIFTVSKTGNNVCYMLVTVNGTQKFYRVNVYRKSIYTVSFSIDNGLSASSQSVEENGYATMPTISTKAGYVVVYDYNFNTPITSNVTVIGTLKAVFNLNGNTITSLTEVGKTLVDVTVPQSIDGVSITGIGEYAFYGAYNMRTVTIANTVTTIGAHAFENCNNLQSVVIPSSVTILGEYAFNNATSLQSVTLGSNLKTISNGAFNGCSSLKTVSIPSTVDKIGAYAFDNCNSLISVTFSDTTTWYVTDNETNYTNKTNGLVITVTNATTNATNMLTNYYNLYLYKI